MKIFYPFNNRLMTERAHDLLVVRTCHSLALHGNEVTLFVGRSGGRERVLEYYGLDECPSLKIVELPILRVTRGFLRPSWHGIFNASCIAAMGVLARRHGCDLVMLSELKLALFLLRFKRLMGVPYVYEVHGLYAKGIGTPEMRPDEKEVRAYSRMDGVITTTAAMMDLLGKYYRLQGAATVVPLACDPRPEKGTVAAGGAFHKVFYFGQLYPLQGVDLLVEAMALVPGAELHIIGDGGYVRELEGLARRIGVSDRVFFHGFVPPVRMVREIMGANLLVIPSRSGGKMPFVAHTKVHEYMALGLPIVATDLPSIREVLDHGRNAFLVRADDAGELARGMSAVLADGGLAAKIADGAYRDAWHYTWAKRAERLTTFLEKVRARR